MTSENEIQTVSAIVPCFNSEKTIERCIQSALSQSLLPTEILIYDDCSTDDTYQIISALADQHKIIKVFRGEENRGAGFARTELLKKATGTYLAFLDADDEWRPNKLAAQIESLRERNADICVCGYEVLDEQGGKLGIRQPPRNISYASMHLADWIPTSMAVVRADLLGTREMPLIRRRQDYAYWLRIFKANKMIKSVTLIGVYGSYYRIKGSLSSNWKMNLKGNYLMFRETIGYSVLFSAICVCANVATRVFRT